MSQVRASIPDASWLNDLDQRRWRMLIAARVFALAAALGLAANVGVVAQSATNFLALCVVAAVVSVPLAVPWVRVWSAIAEGALAALVLGNAGDTVEPLLVYLVVPPLAAGLEAGRAYAFAAVVTETAAVLGGLFAGHALENAGVVALALAPWLLVGTGMGMLGAWFRDSTPREAVEQAGYESAHRLLAQLRAVSRRLSSGLDTPSLAQQSLARFVEDLDAYRAVLLVRAHGEACVPLASHGSVPFIDTPEDDATVIECWSRRAPAQRRMPSGSAQARNRVALPLTVGPRTIGAVVVDCPAAADPEALTHLNAFLVEQALKLETAILFEEVRSLATTEERHRLAREIHDGVAQEVASLGYLVDALTSCADVEKAQETARDLRGELSRIVSELRLSIFDLRAGVTAHGGLGTALSDYAREVGARSGLMVHLALSERPQRLRIDVETELLRIAQEAINNARKHARANNLWVSLNVEPPFVVLRVEDDGIGSPELRADRYGLHIMRERAERIGADLSISPRRRGGTSVVVVMQPPTANNSGGHHADHSLAR